MRVYLIAALAVAAAPAALPAQSHHVAPPCRTHLETCDRREDRRELRQDRRHHEGAADRREDRREIRRDARELHGDRRDVRHDRRDFRGDHRDLRRDRRR